MQLDAYSAQVAAQISALAGLGDERTKQIAETLAGAAEPAVRLALLAALTDAADEISSVLLDLPGSPTVAIRLDGDEAVVDVRPTGGGTATAAAEARDESDASARISLRLSEALKSDIDAAAARDGVSVNTWLVRAASVALNPDPFESLAALGRNFGSFGAGVGSGTGSAARGPGRRGGTHGGGQHVTGWING
jgi:HicB-like protein involved in pilus formation